MIQTLPPQRGSMAAWLSCLHRQPGFDSVFVMQRWHFTDTRSSRMRTWKTNSTPTGRETHRSPKLKRVRPSNLHMVHSGRRNLLSPCDETLQADILCLAFGKQESGVLGPGAFDGQTPSGAPTRPSSRVSNTRARPFYGPGRYDSLLIQVRRSYTFKRTIQRCLGRRRKKSRYSAPRNCLSATAKPYLLKGPQCRISTLSVLPHAATTTVTDGP